MRDVVGVRALDGAFAGDLIGPADGPYETARQVWNGMVDRRPALIARCADEEDVVAALRFARERDLAVAVRGGGHNVAGSAVCDDGVVIDLSAQKHIDVDPDRRIARAQPGVLLGELDRATQTFGLAVPTGNVSMTGVAGLTLGGGLGWIARKHGPACDNLLSAEVVTADGDRVTAGAGEHADLLWGLRGGGGNFGVVTSFEYRLHPVGPQVIAGGVVHAFSDAPEVFRFFADFVATAPDELSVAASTFRASPALPVSPEMHGELVTVLAVCYAGDLAEGERVLEPLRSFGRPLADLVAPMPYTALQSGSDAAYPNGQRNYWKSHYVDEITDGAIATLEEHARRMPSPLSSFYFQHLGGAIGRAGADTAAFGHRDAVFDFNILTVWREPAADAENVAWARDLSAAMQPYSTGVYVNNLGTEGADRVRDAYAPATYERLLALKDAYDPDNVFRMNQNLAPRPI
ncbi:MAG: FAD-linked oxidase [Solirubrobacterales bacterium]|nr:FAD-linked oxidase [Solirubrobacterales bacterium]